MQPQAEVLRSGIVFDVNAHGVELAVQMVNSCTNSALASFPLISKFILGSTEPMDYTTIVVFLKTSLSFSMPTTEITNFDKRKLTKKHIINLALNSLLLCKNGYDLISGKTSNYEIYSTAQCIANIVNESYILLKN